MLKPKAYRRDRTKFNPDFKPNETDRKILVLLVRYRYLRGSFIRALLQISRRTGNYRLHQLWTNRYIDKPDGQGNGYNSLNDTHVYISPTGRAYLDEEHPEATNLTREKNDMPYRQFRHMMMICDMLSSIEIGMQGTGCEFITQAEILEKTSHPHPLKFQCTIRHGSQSLRTHIIPDAVFGIRYPNGKTRLFLVEAEHKGAITRSTFALSSTLKKILAYEDVRKTGTIKQLRKHGFTVLFGCPVHARITSSTRAVVEHLGKSDLFLFGYVPTHEKLYKSPEPRPELFTGVWERGGMEPISIKETPH